VVSGEQSGLDEQVAALAKRVDALEKQDHAAEIGAIRARLEQVPALDKTAIEQIAARKAEESVRQAIAQIRPGPGPAAARQRSASNRSRRPAPQSAADRARRRATQVGKQAKLAAEQVEKLAQMLVAQQERQSAVTREARAGTLSKQDARKKSSELRKQNKAELLAFARELPDETRAALEKALRIGQRKPRAEGERRKKERKKHERGRKKGKPAQEADENDEPLM
jgi:hypothetical protein